MVLFIPKCPALGASWSCLNACFRSILDAMTSSPLDREGYFWWRDCSIAPFCACSIRRGCGPRGLTLVFPVLMLGFSLRACLSSLPQDSGAFSAFDVHKCRLNCWFFHYCFLFLQVFAWSALVCRWLIDFKIIPLLALYPTCNLAFWVLEF